MSQTKTEISLRIHTVWSVFIVRRRKLCILGYPKTPSEDSDKTAGLRRFMFEGTFSDTEAYVTI